MMGLSHGNPVVRILLLSPRLKPNTWPLVRLAKKFNICGPFSTMLALRLTLIMFMKTIWLVLPYLLILSAINLPATLTCVFIIVGSSVLPAS